MATSRYSYLRQYAPYISPYNVDVIKDVMAYKQGRVDANRARMYEQIDYLMGQELAKPQDREYLRTRMSDTIARINEQFDGVDLSSDGVTRAIQGEISSVLDDKVINAIAGTREFYRLQESIQKIKDDHPELYSPVNEYVANSPYYQWYNDGKVGSRLGALHYTPYYDYTKEIANSIQKFREENKGKKFPIQKTVNGKATGEIIEVSEDRLSDAQIRNFILPQLNGRAREQINIEATYLASTNPVFQDPNNVRQFMTDYMGRYDRELAALREREKALESNPYEQQYIRQDIEDLKNRKAEDSIRVNQILASGNPTLAAQFVIESRFLDNMANTWKYNNTSYERKKDEVYFATLQEDRLSKQLNLELQKYALQERLTEARIRTENAKADKLEAEAAWTREHPDEPYPGSSSSTRTPSGRKPSYDPAITNIGVSAGASIDPADYINESMVSAGNAEKLAYEQLYQSFSQESIKGIMELVKKDMADNPGIYTDLNDREALYKWINRNGGEKLGQMNTGTEEGNAIYNAYKNLQNAIARNQSLHEMIKKVTVNAEKNILNDDVRRAVAEWRQNGGLPESIRSQEAVDALTVLTSAIGGASGKYGIDRWLKPVAGWSEKQTEEIKANTFGNVLNEALKNNPSAVISAFNTANKLLGGASGNIYDYLDIRESNWRWNLFGDEGRVKLAPYKKNEPPVVTLLREMQNNQRSIGMFYNNVLKDLYDEIYSKEQVARIVGNDVKDFSINQFTFSKNAPVNTWQNEGYLKLSSIAATKANNAGVDFPEGKDIDMVILRSVLNTDGSYSRFLITKSGTKFQQPIPISDEELIANGFNPNVTSRNYRTENYKSDFADCSFVDTSTGSGRAYDEHITNTLGMARICAIEDVSADMYDLVNTEFGFIKDDQIRDEFVNRFGFLVLAGNELRVQLEGHNDRGHTYITASFYDKDTVDSSTPTKIFDHTIEMQGEEGNWADYYNNILESAPQFFYLLALRSAIDKRATQMEAAYNKQRRILNVTGDSLDKIEQFAKDKKLGGEQNAQ